ncbi:MAG: transglycosylase family protein [Acidimicrobiales bacterium]
MHRPWLARLRYVGVGALIVIVAFFALALGERPDPSGEFLVVAVEVDPAPTPAVPTPMATPGAEPAEAATSPASEPEASNVVGEEAAVELANTDPLSAGSEGAEPAGALPVVDGFYVPNFVAAGDRTGSGTDRSVDLQPPTPVPAPPVVAQPTPVPAPTPTPVPQPTPVPPTPTPKPDNGGGGGGGGPTEAQWEALRQCESGGNYSILNPSGQYRGAYQFSRATWDWIAGMFFPNLVGVDPAQAAPGAQDRMAKKLYETAGWQQWPVCGRHLL